MLDKYQRISRKWVGLFCSAYALPTHEGCLDTCILYITKTCTHII